MYINKNSTHVLFYILLFVSLHSYICAFLGIHIDETYYSDTDC